MEAVQPTGLGGDVVCPEGCISKSREKKGRRDTAKKRTVGHKQVLFYHKSSTKFTLAVAFCLFESRNFDSFLVIDFISSQSCFPHLKTSG